MPYPIKPSDIDSSKHFYNTFDNSETEVSARLLVRLAQQNGDWRDFTQAEINTLSKHNFCFNRLVTRDKETDYIKKNDDGSFSFTHKFIAKCWLKAPIDTKVI